MDKSWRTLLITSVGVFMASLDLFIVNIAFPDIAADFGSAKLSDLSWVLNAYAIVFAALLVPFGRIADRVGRKRIFIYGLLVFTLGSGLSAAAPTLGFLVAARIVQAAGGAMMIPTSLGLILAAFPAEKRAAAVGAWSAAGGVAAALGPPLGGLLVAADWRWIFIVNIPLGLVMAVVSYRSLQEVRVADPGPRPDGLGVVLIAAGIALLTSAIVKGPDWGWGDPRTLAAFAGSVALVALFLRRSARHPAPVIELDLLKVRAFAFSNAATMVFFAGFGAMLLAGVLLLTEVWGYSVTRAGFALVPGPAMAALFAVPSGRLTGRYGARPVVVAGGLVFASGFAVMLATLGPTPDYLGSFLPGFMIGGIGVGLSLGSLPGAATSSLPPERFATGAAVFGAARQIGAAIGVAVLVALLADPGPADLYDHLLRGLRFAGAAGIGTALLGLGIGAARRPQVAPTAGERPSEQATVAEAVA
jgi:EmrB/QacA subfamily drug resistance transporter